MFAKKIVPKGLVLLCVVLFALSSNTYASESVRVGIANPAAVYCRELGYEYKIVDTSTGQQGICVFSEDAQCDAWNFLMGRCGQEYSYCALNGYEIITRTDGIDTLAREYGVCVEAVPQERESIDEGYVIIGSVTDLVDLSQGATKAINVDDNDRISDYLPDAQFYLDAPSSFDWRSYDGENWMTSVKDQGSCSSCWAFSAVGAVEARFNIQLGDPDLNLDLSEQYLVSCSDDGNCSGGSSGLFYIKDYGIPDESCFPYVAANAPCSDRCSDWEDRIIKIYDITGMYTGIEEMKEHIANFGPGVGNIYMYGYFDEDDIYRCTTTGQENHFVVLAGYNDTGGYWIVKNSWGSSWNGDGYFKVGYGECRIDNGMMGVTPCQDADLDGYYYAQGDYCGPVDCDDGDYYINPGADEDCFDGVDNNCDGLTDNDDLDCLDIDGDGIPESSDNCPDHPNGPSAGSCTRGPRALIGDPCTIPGDNTSECGTNGFCSMAQEDTLPPSGNSSPLTAHCGDACECEGDFDTNGVQDGVDALTFKSDFGRFDCTALAPCNGDFDCSGVVDGLDAIMFKQDFGRFDCPDCPTDPWCVYE